MLFKDIPQDFKTNVKIYFNKILKTVKENGNYLSINGTLVPKNLRTGHQNLEIGSEKHINVMIESLYLLHLFHNFSINNNIFYSIFYGNLLGYYRENDIIMWDDDVDIIIVNKNGINTLLELWRKGGQEYPIWDKHWSYKNITLNDSSIILIKCQKFKVKNYWFKLRLNTQINKNELRDLGGIDLILRTDIDMAYNSDLTVLNKYEETDINYPIVKYGPIYARVLVKKPTTIILNNQYGINWKKKIHPSLHKDFDIVTRSSARHWRST